MSNRLSLLGIPSLKSSRGSGSDLATNTVDESAVSSSVASSNGGNSFWSSRRLSRSRAGSQSTAHTSRSTSPTATSRASSDNASTSALTDVDDGSRLGISKSMSIDTRIANSAELSFPSLLSPPNPAFNAASQTKGILTNAIRPPYQGAFTPAACPAPFTVQPPSASTSSSDVSAQDASIRPHHQHALSMSALGASRPHLTSLQSDSSVGSIVLHRPKTAHDPVTETENARSTTRIRFAPLPDPRNRPRRYSTGRDVWADGDGNDIHVYAADGRRADVGSWEDTNLPTLGDAASSSNSRITYGDASPADSEDSCVMARHQTLSVPNTPMSVNSTYSAKSIASRLFRRSKSKLQDSDDEEQQSTSTLGALLSGFPLSKSKSAPGEAEEARKTGISMRRTSSAASSNSRDAPKQRKKIVYPSVAQSSARSRQSWHLQAATTSLQPGDDFVEWGNITGRGSLGSRSANSTDDEDDGSGMAWVRRRRLEREKREREQAELAATAGDELGSAKTSGSIAQVAMKTPNSKVLSPLAPNGVKASLESELGSLHSAVEHISISPATPSSAASAPSDESGDDTEGQEGSDDEDAEGISPAEAAEEERLNEEARRTTGGAAREKYHTHEHRERTHQIEAGSTPSSFHAASYSRSASFRSELPLLKP